MPFKAKRPGGLGTVLGAASSSAAPPKPPAPPKPSVNSPAAFLDALSEAAREARAVPAEAQTAEWMRTLAASIGKLQERAVLLADRMEEDSLARADRDRRKSQAEAEAQQQAVLESYLQQK